MNTNRRSINGVINERLDTHITATLIDPSGWSYYAEIDLDRFADTDQPHCQPGAQFTIQPPGPELKLLRKAQRKTVTDGN